MITDPDTLARLWLRPAPDPIEDAMCAFRAFYRRPKRFDYAAWLNRIYGYPRSYL